MGLWPSGEVFRIFQNLKSSYIGPVLEKLKGPKRGCSDFRRILPI